MSSLTSTTKRRPRQYAVGYLRVSSPGRQEENCSIPTQLAGIRAYCAREGLTLKVVLEEAETAIDEDLGKRPVLSEARRLLREGEADTLVIFKVDRVFRNQYQPAALLTGTQGHRLRAGVHHGAVRGHGHRPVLAPGRRLRRGDGARGDPRADDAGPGGQREGEGPDAPGAPAPLRVRLPLRAEQPRRADHRRLRRRPGDRAHRAPHLRRSTSPGRRYGPSRSS